MIIGIDFDNTLVDHRRSLWSCARAARWIPEEFPADKTRIRDHLRSGYGNEAWTSLQAVAYGEGISEASLFPGASEFLERCHARRITVHVVSHKTRFSAIGGVDLHHFARHFLETSGLLGGAAPLLEPSNIHFEPTREAKVARIAALACTHFVDDLEETFLEPGFPDIHRYLFAPGGISSSPDDALPWLVVEHWNELLDRILP